MEEPDDLSDGDVNIVSEQNEPRFEELRVGPSYNVTLSNVQRTVSSSFSEIKLTAITYNIIYQYMNIQVYILHVLKSGNAFDRSSTSACSSKSTC